MNEYVQKYLEKKEAERLEEKRNQAIKLITTLRIGEKEYAPTNPANTIDFPLSEWDEDKKVYKQYRYNAGALSEEDIDKLFNSGKDDVTIDKPTRSGWHTFATVMIVLGGIAVAIALIAVLADDWHRNWTPFFIVLGGFLMELGFWAIVQLLANIKLDLDKQLAKEN